MLSFCNYFKVYSHWDERNPAFSDVYSVSVQGNLVASGSADKTVQVWNMETNSKIWQLQHEGAVYCVQLHDKQLISSSHDNSTRVWNLENGQEIHRLVHEGPTNFDLSPDETILAVGFASGVVMWDFRNATKLKEFDLEREVADLRFNPAGDRLIVGASDGWIFKIDLAYEYGENNEER